MREEGCHPDSPASREEGSPELALPGALLEAQAERPLLAVEAGGWPGPAVEAGLVPAKTQAVLVRCAARILQRIEGTARLN